jgi:hypothetical protein
MASLSRRLPLTSSQLEPQIPAVLRIIMLKFLGNMKMLVGTVLLGFEIVMFGAVLHSFLVPYKVEYFFTS